MKLHFTGRRAQYRIAGLMAALTTSAVLLRLGPMPNAAEPSNTSSSGSTNPLLQSLWDTSQYSKYFETARTVITDAFRANQLNASHYSALLSSAEDMVGRTVDQQKLESQVDLAAKSDVISALLSFDISKRLAGAPEKGALQLRTSQLISTLLTNLEKEIISEYKAKPVVINVSPPAGVPNAIAGMSSDAIQDPVLRGRYEAAIRENALNSVTNTRQAFLRSILQKLEPRAREYLKKHGSTN